MPKGRPHSVDAFVPEPSIFPSRFLTHQPHAKLPNVVSRIAFIRIRLVVRCAGRRFLRSQVCLQDHARPDYSTAQPHDVEHSRKEYLAGTNTSLPSFRQRIPISTSCQEAARLPRSCVPETQGGGVRPRLLLASTRRLSLHNHPADQRGVLEAEIQGKCRSRQALCQDAPRSWLARGHRLGMRSEAFGGGHCANG